MTNDEIEDLVDDIYRRDQLLGFCGHDIDGKSMRQIVLLVTHRVACSLDQSFASRPQDERYTAAQVRQNLMSLFSEAFND